MTLAAPPVSRLSAALRAAALALIYCFILQSSLSPLATVRMESNASIFGVRCLPTGDDSSSDTAAHGSCCDAACLLHAQGAAAPPPVVVAQLPAPARAARIAPIVAPRRFLPPSHDGPPPHAPRAPPFV